MTAARTPDDLRLAERAAAKAVGQDVDLIGHTTTITIRGVEATLVYRVDLYEHLRRRHARAGSVTRLDWLHTLLSLPAGMPVDLDTLNVNDRRIINDLPPGCVEVADGTVTRLLVRPVSVDLAVVTSNGAWRAGLDKAGQFSAYCTRLLAISDMPYDLPDAQAEASSYGIGLVVNAACGPVIAVSPEPFIPTAHTAAGWRFAEQAYDGIVDLC